MIPRWAEDATLEDFDGGARKIAETIGIQATIRLMDQYGGTNTYIPKADDVLRRARNRRIIKEYNGGASSRLLAYRYGLTDRMIQMIVEGVPDQIDGQIGLFDVE